MAGEVNRIIIWLPRILSIVFILFLFLMSFDVFESSSGIGETLLGFLIHNLPALVLLIVLIISWKYEIVGGIAFIFAGLLYAIFIVFNILKTGFEWYSLAWILQISGVAFLIGILFVISWKKHKLGLQRFIKSKIV